MNSELIGALKELVKEKDIDGDVIFEAIENALILAYRQHNLDDKDSTVKAFVDRTTGDFSVVVEKTVVEEVTKPNQEITLDEARQISGTYTIGDVVQIPADIRAFGRIAAQKATNVILQKIREEERNVIFGQYESKKNTMVTGIVQKINDNSISINLGKIDATLPKSEQIPTETFLPTERIKLYITDVRNSTKGAPKITVSRKSEKLVEQLFMAEVTEIKDGTVEIMDISREAGVRSKVSVKSNDEHVDPLGACVGVNSARINAIMNELRGEKIDVVPWNENAAIYIEKALSPANVISVIADSETKTAKVIVPDYQLSLAIGKGGLNARLAARLTKYKIDIKSESQARELEEFNSKEFITEEIDDSIEDENIEE